MLEISTPPATHATDEKPCTISKGAENLTSSLSYDRSSRALPPRPISQQCINTSPPSSYGSIQGHQESCRDPELDVSEREREKCVAKIDKFTNEFGDSEDGESAEPHPTHEVSLLETDIQNSSSFLTQNQPSEDEKGLNRKLSGNGEDKFRRDDEQWHSGTPNRQTLSIIPSPKPSCTYMSSTTLSYTVFKTPVETWLTSSAIPDSTFPIVPPPPARQDNRPGETHQSNRNQGTENEYSEVEVMTRPTCNPKLKPMAYVDETFKELLSRKTKQRLASSQTALISTASPAPASPARSVSSAPSDNHSSGASKVKAVNMARSTSPVSAKASEYGRDTNRETKALSSTATLRTLEVNNDDPTASWRSFSCARETQQRQYLDHPTSPRRLPRPMKRASENRGNSDYVSDGRNGKRAIDKMAVSMLKSKQPVRVVEAEVAGKIVTVSLQGLIASESIQQDTGQRTDDDAGPAQDGRNFSGDLRHDGSVHAQDCKKDTEEEAPDEFESGRSYMAYSSSAEGSALAKVTRPREFNMPTLLGSPPQSNCGAPLPAAQAAWWSFSEGGSVNSETLVSSFANVSKPKEIRHFAPTFEAWTPKLSAGYIYLQQKRLSVTHGSRTRSAVVSETELEILRSLTLRPNDTTRPETREQTGIDPTIQAILRQGEAWFGQLKAVFSNSSDSSAVRVWELERRDAEKNRTMEILVRCVNDMFEERKDLLEQLQRLNQRERRWWRRNEPDDEASDVV